MTLMESGIIGCYCIYVDDTLVLVKEDQIHKMFNLFYKHGLLNTSLKMKMYTS